MNEIDGKTRICGLMANPVEHTLSPLLHNTLAEKMNINMAYVPLKPEKEGLAAAVKGAYALNLLGLNVSVPYKQQVMESLLEIEPMAKAIGAVNTLVRIEGGYKGYNTDIMGLKRAMELEKISIKDRPVVILGAGGVSKAVAHLCVREGASQVFLLNRTLCRAQELAEQVNEYYHTQMAVAMEMAAYGRLPKDRYLVIQTTNVGMYPKTEEAVIEDKSFYEMVEVAYDIVYTPFHTRFMQLAADSGAKTFNGLRMLAYQGVCAFEMWNQVTVPEEISEYVYEQLKKELKV